MRSKKELVNRITEYLCHGGLFNPDLMDHDQVRDLLIDCRIEFLKTKEEESRRAEIIKRLAVLSHKLTQEGRYVSSYTVEAAIEELRGLH